MVNLLVETVNVARVNQESQALESERLLLQHPNFWCEDSLDFVELEEQLFEQFNVSTEVVSHDDLPLAQGALTHQEETVEEE